MRATRIDILNKQCPISSENSVYTHTSEFLARPCGWPLTNPSPQSHFNLLAQLISNLRSLAGCNLPPSFQSWVSAISALRMHCVQYQCDVCVLRAVRFLLPRGVVPFECYSTALGVVGQPVMTRNRNHLLLPFETNFECRSSQMLENG